VRVHVLGNVLGPIFVYATSLIAVSMILASGLSFLGLGVKPPEPEWGLMLNTLRTAIYMQPWVAALPGLMIFITSIAFNLLADGVRGGHGDPPMNALKDIGGPAQPLLSVAGLVKRFPLQERPAGPRRRRGARRRRRGFDVMPRARRWAWSANRAAASRPPRAC
jgi:hypothetical protein